MEKRVPHHKLSLVKTLIHEGKVKATLSALTGASKLDLTFEGIINIIKTLSPSDFYKSMTTYADSKIWQDVYKHQTVFGEIYLKITVVEEVIIISFKEL